MAISTGKNNLLVEKGEKIGLGVAAVLGIGLLALGLMSALDRPQDPEAFAKGLEAKAGNLNTTMNGPPGTIDPVAPSIEKPVDSKPIPTVPSQRPYYDPTQPPDPRRLTPIILTLAEGQADMAVVKILANDFELERDPQTNEVTKVKVGLVGAKDTGSKIDPKQAQQFLEGVRGRFKEKIPRKKKDPPAGAGMFGGTGFGGMPGAGMLGGPGGPGGLGPPGGARGGFGEGGEGPGAPGPGGFGMLGGAGTPSGKDLEVVYIEVENDDEMEKQMNGRRLAITIRPQKMAVLQAAFPYRAQLERFRQALRKKDLAELYASPDDMPTFNGVDVQRRAYGPKGELLENWQTVNLALNSQDLRAVKLYYKEDPADLQRVMLHEDHMLVMPLAQELAGKYPEHKLKTIKESIEKMKKADPANTAAPPPKNRITGGENPFSRGEGANAGLYNPGGMGEGEGGLFIPPGPGGPGGRKSKEKTGPVTLPAKYEPPDFIYVRAYDGYLQDGLTYEYRMRVKVKNPNFGKKGLVSKESDAEPEELPPLEEHWYVFPQKVSVPRSWNFYVIDPLPPAKTIKALPAPRPELGQAVVQFQQWIDYIYPTPRLREPVGDWVQAELLATRGQFVYGRAFTPLPFWSATENAYVLREIPGEVTPKGKDPRRGVEMFPIRPQTLLAVDVQGGKPVGSAAKVPPNLGEKTNRGGMIDDNSAAEVLFLLPDGTLEVRSSARDRADAQRKERDEAFKKWVDDTEKKAPIGPAGKKGGGGIDF